jgi:hypothetical protein
VSLRYIRARVLELTSQVIHTRWKLYRYVKYCNSFAFSINGHGETSHFKYKVNRKGFAALLAGSDFSSLSSIEDVEQEYSIVVEEEAYAPCASRDGWELYVFSGRVTDLPKLPD